MKKGILFVEAGETLQVTFSPHVPLEMEQQSSSLADQMEQEQARAFRKAITPMLEIADLPLEHVFLDASDRIEKGSTVLRFRSMRWETSRSGDFEPIIEVWLHSNGFKQRVGVYRGRVKIPVSQPAALRESSYVKELNTVLFPMLSDLQKHFRKE